MEQKGIKVADGRQARRKTPEAYRHTFEESVGEEYLLLSDYEKASQRVIVQHRTCGSEFKVMPLIFIKRPGCRCCDNQRKRLDPDIYKQRFEQNLGKQFELVDVYTRQKDPLRVRHLACGTVFSILPVQVISNLHCPICKKDHLESEAFFLEALEKEKYQGYQVSYDHYQEDQVVQIKHIECGHQFEEYPGVFLKKPSCPACEKDYLEQTSFQLKIKDRYQGRFEILSSFRGYQYPVCVRHTDPNCLKYSYPFATNLSTGKYRCPHCETRRRK